jgi:hypothetical protein
MFTGIDSYRTSGTVNTRNLPDWTGSTYFF